MTDVVLAVELERVRQLNDRLVSENAALRRAVLDVGHRASVLAGRCKSCEFHPDQSKAETQAIVRKNREHA